MYKWLDSDAIKSLKDKRATQKSETITKWTDVTFRTNSFVSRPLLLLALPRGWGTRAWLRCDWRLWLNSFSFPFYLHFLFWNLIFAPSFLPVFNALVSFAELRSTLSGPRIANIALMAAVPSFQRNPTLIMIFDILSMLLTIRFQDRKRDFFGLFTLRHSLKESRLSERDSQYPQSIA